jgi:hypothetical protein
MTDKFKAEQFEAICQAVDLMSPGVSFAVHSADHGVSARIEWYVAGERKTCETVQPTAKMLLLDVARRLP